MHDTLVPCPDDTVLSGFVSGQLPAGESSSIELHLAHCTSCLERLRGLKPADSVLRALQQGAPQRGAAEHSYATVPAVAQLIEKLQAPSVIEVSDTTLGSTTHGSATVGKSAGIAPSSAVRYRIVRAHAKGALGEVFVAQDNELDREVALKEIQFRHWGDPASRGRFVLEAKLTGGLEHPGIVPVYGLGAYADGRPYYAMKFIRGESLKTAVEQFHASAEKSFTSAPFRQLLRHFIDVCNAVAYAHSRGVLHRDLKPGNIMLGSFGETLVVDWGLAKVINQQDYKPSDPSAVTGSDLETHAGTVLGTPAFMSPEQAGGRLQELKPASDIFSLGATLFYLLTKQPPFSGSSAQSAVVSAQRGDWTWPAETTRPIPPALKAICTKAMATRPADRYADAQELAAELERWLADELVKAYREPWLQQTRRWLRKHPAMVAGVTATLVVGIIGLAIGAAVVSERNFRLKTSNQNLGVANQNLQVANHNLQVAQTQTESERKVAQAVRDFLQYDLLGQPDPNRAADNELKADNIAMVIPQNPTVKQLLDRAALALTPDKIEQRFPKQPLVQAEVLATVGESYVSVGSYSLAVGLLERSQVLYASELGKEQQRTLELADKLGNAYLLANRHSDALPIFAARVSRLQEKLGKSHQETINALNHLALAQAYAGQIDKAIASMQEQLKASQDFPPDDKTRLGIINNLAGVYVKTGRPKEAILLLTEGISKAQGKFQNPDVLQMMAVLAWIHQSQGDSAGALKLAQQVEPMMRKLQGVEHPETLAVIATLARALKGVKRGDEALALCDQTVDQLRAKVGTAHPLTNDARKLRAEIVDQGDERLEQEIAELEVKLKNSKAEHGEDHFLTWDAKTKLAEAYAKSRKHAQAIVLYQELIALFRKLGAPVEVNLARMVGNLGVTYHEIKEFEKAVPPLEESLERIRRLKGHEDEQAVLIKHTLLEIYGKLDRYDKQVPIALEMLEQFRAKREGKPEELLRRLESLALALSQSDQSDKSIPYWEEAFAVSRGTLGPGHEKTLMMKGFLAAAYVRNAPKEKALELFTEFLRDIQARAGDDSWPYANVIRQMAPHLLAGHEYAFAEKYLRTSLRIQLREAPRQGETFDTQVLLGAALGGLQQFAEAEALLLAGYKGLAERTLDGPERDEHLLNAKKRIADFYTAWDRPREAGEWNTRVFNLSAAEDVSPVDLIK